MFQGSGPKFTGLQGSQQCNEGLQAPFFLLVLYPKSINQERTAISGVLECSNASMKGLRAPRQTFRGFQAPQMNNVRAPSTERWGSGLCRKHFRAPGLRSTPPPPPPRPWLAANKSLAFFIFASVLDGL